MTSVIFKLLTSFTLTVWAVVISGIAFTDRWSDYLHPAFHPGLMLSGVVLAGLAVAVWFFPDSAHCHGGGRSIARSVFMTVILTVPLAAAAAISPGSFGSTAVLNRGLVNDISGLPAFSPPTEPPLPQADGSVGQATALDPAAYLQKNARGQIKAETVDLLYAASEPTMREDFENKEVELIGQFVPARTGNPSGDRFHLVRMYVMCCAADARPVAVAVQSRETFPEMTWVRVTGRATFPLESGKRSAVIIADTVEKTDPPEESFIY